MNYARSRYFTKTVIHGTLARLDRLKGTGQAPARSLTIFTYHSFCTTKPRRELSSLPAGMFERQIRFLQRHYRLVSLADGLAALAVADAEPAPMAAITIDDGFEDNYHIACPILARYGAPSTIFVATDFIDNARPPWPTRLRDVVGAMAAKASTPWPAGEVERRCQQLKTRLGRLSAEARWAELDHLIAEHDLRVLPEHRPLSWDQIRAMSRAGIAIGSHTASHGYLPFLDTSEVTRELQDSKRRIEQELQHECTWFAYPNGDWSPDAASMVQVAGYHAALTQEFGSNASTKDPYALKRVEVPAHDPLASFDYRAQRALASVAR